MSGAILRFGTSLGRQAIELCWPCPCVSCGLFVGALLCAPCRGTLVRHGGLRCRLCDDASAAPLCGRCRQRRPRLLSGARGVYRYEGAIKRAILAGKNDGQERLWPLVARLMGADPEARALAHAADALVPIPLAPHRRMSRGYNPSALLAYALSRLWHRPVAHLLACGGAPNRAPQSRLGAAARQQAAQGAFVPVRPGACAPGGRLLLVDDVITTGATLHAAAQALMLMGAHTLTAVALARQTREHGARAPTPL